MCKQYEARKGRRIGALERTCSFTTRILCTASDAENETTHPRSRTVKDGLTQERANVDTPTGDGAMSTAPAARADARNADTMAKGVVRVDE